MFPFQLDQAGVRTTLPALSRRSVPVAPATLALVSVARRSRKAVISQASKPNANSRCAPPRAAASIDPAVAEDGRTATCCTLQASMGEAMPSRAWARSEEHTAELQALRRNW